MTPEAPSWRWWGWDTTSAYLVINDGNRIGWAGFDPQRADEYARNTGGAVVKVPVVAQYPPYAADEDRTPT